MTDPVLLVGVGGALGALTRYLVGQTVETRTRDTLAVNVLGSFGLGALVAAAARPETLLLFGTGFCGAFTTFSTFAVETVSSYETGGQRAAVRNVALNLGGALVAVGLGAAVAGALL